jgi:diaminohydroxyphosphoribosylaminopyrimidine deaminase / 5-amino-6-(5-phosphoribosylamino)uracil reductase
MPQPAMPSQQSPVASNPLWDQFLVDFLAGKPLPPSPLQAMFEPLGRPTVDDMVILGQMGQTLDGRIATVSGQSKYINGQAGLAHLHQLRALVDAVIVGVGTALADDPQLTVRLVKGNNPARIVIDPKARLPLQSRIWLDDGVPKIWVVANGLTVKPPPQVELLTLPTPGDGFDPILILKSLRQRGLKRILIEGGAETVSRFMQAKCLDRLHLIVAPIIMGSGRPSFNLPPIEHMDHALRLPVVTHLLDNEIVFDCDLRNQRNSITAV